MRLWGRKRNAANQAAAEAALQDAEKEHQTVRDQRDELEPVIARLKENADKNHLYPAVIAAWLRGSGS